MMRDDRLHRRPAERRHTGDHLEYHAPQAVHVRAAIHSPLRRGLLWADVRWRTDGDARVRDPGMRRAIHRAGQSEIRDEGVLAEEKNVLRLDVAVDDTLRMCVVE